MMSLLNLNIFLLRRTLCHLLNFGELPNLKTETLNNANDPIKKYQPGYDGRIEYVLASKIVYFSQMILSDSSAYTNYRVELNVSS
jgi:hypothetical protein